VPQRHTVGGAIPSTVEEVVGSGRLVHRRWFARTTAADRAAVADAIQAVGLGDRRSAMVATLSGGQQRRVLIARALAGRPDVLIMDEPTAGVDAESQESLVRTLHGLVEQGLTLLIVTHEIAPLRPMLTRVVALDAGRLVSDTPVARGALTPEALPGEYPGPGGGHHDAPQPLDEVGRRSPLADQALGPHGGEG
jgi:zinc transport system ATP-binding protein